MKSTIHEATRNRTKKARAGDASCDFVIVRYRRKKRLQNDPTTDEEEEWCPISICPARAAATPNLGHYRNRRLVTKIRK